MRKHSLLTAVVLFNSWLAFGQDSLKTTTLQEIITTASRFEQPVIEVPRSVTIIGRDVIEKSIYNTVGELLANQSGVYVVGATQTPGSNQSLFMRGANSNQVAIMIDGSRISDPSSPNGATELSELSLAYVERIEIIRGPASTLYGGAAIGGVINIITRKNSQAGFSGNVGLQGGTFGDGAGTLSDNINLNYAFQSGLYVNLSALNQRVSGLNATIDTVTQTGVYKTTDEDDFKKDDFLFKAGYKNRIWDVFASYKKVTQRADLDNSTYTDDDNAYLDFDRNLVQYNITRVITDRWRASLLGSWSNSERQNVNDSSKIDSDGSYDGNYFKGVYDANQSTNELQINGDFEKVKWVFGGGLFQEGMDFNTYYYSSSWDYESKVNYDTINSSAKTAYVFAQADITLNAFRLLLGSRYSHHSLFGSYVTYEVNPSFQWNNFLFYGSLSSGFNPASLYQLYDPTQGFGSYTTKGNKDLKAEESLSFELGVKKQFMSGNYLTVSAFTTNTRNVVEYVYLWNKDTDLDELSYLDYKGDTYINITQQVVSGVEVEGHVELGKVYFNASLSTLKGEVSVASDDIETEHTGGHHVQLYNYGIFVEEDEVSTNKMIRRPQVNAFAELGYKPVEKLSFNLAYRLAGSRYDVGYDEMLGPYGALNVYNVKQYNLFDIGANWKLRKNVLLSLKVENILDEDYQEILGYQTRGRSAYVKLNFSW